MTKRQEYKLKRAEVLLLAAASKPLEAARVAGVKPSPYATGMFIYTWCSIGDKYGFDWATARHADDKDERYFTAMPLEAPCSTGPASSEGQASEPSSEPS